MDTQDILHSSFCVAIHKQAFTNYLEVCIDKNGVVHYAVPSHQGFLIRQACKQLNVTVDELNDLCPRKYYCDFITWLTMTTDCIAVWNDFTIGNKNEVQKHTLEMLKREGLYRGKI